MDLEELLLQIIENKGRVSELDIIRDLQIFAKDKLKAMAEEGKLKKIPTINTYFYEVNGK